MNSECLGDLLTSPGHYAPNQFFLKIVTLCHGMHKAKSESKTQLSSSLSTIPNKPTIAQLVERWTVAGTG